MSCYGLNTSYYTSYLQKGVMMKSIQLQVKGMHCPSCEIILSESLEEAGATIVTANHQKGTVSIQFDEKKLSEDKISTVITEEGYEVI